MILAEELLLLLYDDESGKPVVDRTKLELGLAGAVLLDLSMRGRVAVAGPGEEIRKGRLVVRDRTTIGDAVLDDALEALAGKTGRTPKTVLGALKKGLRDRLLHRVTGQGLVRQEDRRAFGIFPVTRWPAVHGAHERGVRSRLHDAVVGGVEPDDRTAALVALLVATDTVLKVIQPTDKRAAKRRAKQIAEGAWAADAVKKAVQDINAALTAAIVAGAGAGAAGS